MVGGLIDIVQAVVYRSIQGRIAFGNLTSHLIGDEVEAAQIADIAAVAVQEGDGIGQSGIVGLVYRRDIHHDIHGDLSAFQFELDLGIVDIAKDGITPLAAREDSYQQHTSGQAGQSMANLQ